MSTWNISLGVQYSPTDRHHPASPRLHWGGWLTVEADTENEARLKAAEATQGQWSGIYPADHEMPARHWPYGCIGRIGVCAKCEEIHVLPPGPDHAVSEHDDLCDWCSWAATYQTMVEEAPNA